MNNLIINISAYENSNYDHQTLQKIYLFTQTFRNDLSINRDYCKSLHFQHKSCN